MYTYNKLYFQYKKLYSIFLKKIILILNDFHEKKYDQKYWEPIIGLYLRRFLLNYLFLKKTIQKKNLYKNLQYKDIEFYRNYREFANSNDFAKLERKQFYKLDTNFSFSKKKITEINFTEIKTNKIKFIIINALIKLKIIKVLIYESYFKKKLKIFLNLRSFFHFSFLPNLKLENFKIDKLKIFKNRLNIISKNEIKKDLILKNIIFFMPINYVENYDTIFREIKKINLSNAIYFDGNEINFDFLKFYIAELRLKQKKILTGQHSLRSGLQDHDVYFDYTRSISDYFLTWGWKHKSKNIYRFSSLRIFSSIDKYKSLKKNKTKNLNICFILCSFSVIGECLYDNFIENKKAEKSRIYLLNRLKEINNAKIFLKPRTGSFLLRNKHTSYKKFQLLKEKTRMHEIFGKFSVVIFERMSLGIVECMYLDQPTIFYYPKNLYQQTNKFYKKLLMQLKKANIYFDDPSMISRILNSQKSIDEWWYKKRNILNRKRVLDNYANTFKYSDLRKIKKLIKI